MPSVSKKQHNFMAAIAKNPAFAKKVGLKPSVGEHFLTADKGKKFGSSSMKKMRKFAEGGLEDGAMESLREAGMKYGMGRKNPKLPGEDIERTDENPVTKKIKDVARDVGKYVMGMPGAVGSGARRYTVNSMKKGGMAKSDAKEDMKMDKSQDKAMIKKAFKQHDAQEHKGGKGTSLKLAKGGSFRSSANGIATKGKTKGTMINMKKGGAC